MQTKCRSHHHMIVITYPGCNQNVRETLKALEANGLLKSFHTTMAFQDGDCLVKLAPASLRKQLLRRQFPCPRSKIITHPYREIIKQLAKRTPWRSLTSPESFAAADTIGRDLDKEVAKYIEKHAGSIKAVFGYEDSCLLTFRTAKKHGIARIYELTAPFWQTSRAIYNSGCQQHPEWSQTMGSLQSQELLERKTEELKLASLVLCISQFVYKSLPESVKAETCCRVVNYGCPKIELIRNSEDSSARTDKKLRVLYVGALSQRKGMADLFQAMKMLNRHDIQLVLLGSLAAPISFYRSQFPDFEYHQPAPHSEVMQLMSTCDVFVFPSLCEGRGMVQLEALSNGLPVIGTVNATTDEIIQDGVEGFIVPVGSAESIAEKIAWFADHPAERKEMSDRAKIKASSISWSTYNSQLISAIHELLDTSGS